jgi:transcriptional regulator of aromatic amino acid metabolism
MHDEEVLNDILPPGGKLPKQYPWSSIEEDARLDLTELINNFEKSILDHAMGQCKSTRQAATYLNTSQSRIARLLKKHRMSSSYRRL